MAESFVEENGRSRRRLEELAGSLSTDDLALRTPYGWTIASLFAHLAWWDQRVLVLLRRWKARGLDESPLDSEAINEALKPLCHAMDPQASIRLCLAAASETDAEIESTSPELIEQILASPNHLRFHRSLHRNDHIHDIESLLRAAKSGP